MTYGTMYQAAALVARACPSLENPFSYVDRFAYYAERHGITDISAEALAFYALEEARATAMEDELPGFGELPEPARPIARSTARGWMWDTFGDRGNLRDR